MFRTRVGPVLLFVTCCLASSSALGCGEGMFNTGKGLPYQAYRAPRPAAVLVYADPAQTNPRKSESLYAGLKKAGHSITVVSDTQGLKQAMQGGHYDVVISPLVGIDAVTTAEGAQTPVLLPVIERALRNSAEVRNRFDLFLIDGASLGQYLAAINKVVGAKG